MTILQALPDSARIWGYEFLAVVRVKLAALRHALAPVSLGPGSPGTGQAGVELNSKVSRLNFR